MAGNLAGETARTCLEKDRKDGANASSAKQIDLYTEEARDLGAAQFMVRNIPNNSTRIFSGGANCKVGASFGTWVYS